jgi:hypothetical protein
MNTRIDWPGTGFEADCLPGKVGPGTCHIDRQRNAVAILPTS